MAEVFLGQIMMGGFNYAPRTFALCNGQLMPIAQNQALFSLLAVRFGGNGTTNFGLPNLQGRTPVGFGPSADAAWQPTPYENGARDGSENVTLTTAQIPAHTHQGQGTKSTSDQRVPTGMLYGTGVTAIYAPVGGPQVQLGPNSVAPAGGNQPHTNMQPFGVINFCIALSGMFPSRN